jgi:hypothetical protein
MQELQASNGVKLNGIFECKSLSENAHRAPVPVGVFVMVLDPVVVDTATVMVLDPVVVDTATVMVLDTVVVDTATVVELTDVVAMETVVGATVITGLGLLICRLFFLVLIMIGLLVVRWPLPSILPELVVVVVVVAVVVVVVVVVVAVVVAAVVGFVLKFDIAL